jgi:hypothetical protein
MANEALTAQENSDFTFEYEFHDEDDAVVSNSEITVLQLTLYNEQDGVIINSRENQSILPPDLVGGDNNGASWDGNTLVLHLGPLDNVISNQGKPSETHVAQFFYKWLAGARQRYQEVRIRVNNIGKVG